MRADEPFRVAPLSSVCVRFSSRMAITEEAHPVAPVLETLGLLIGFVMIIVLLLFRPAGLFGRRDRQR